MSKNPVKGTTFYATMLEWSVSEREAIERKVKILSVAFGGACVVIIGLIAAIIPLTVMHEFTPIPIVVDKQTGDYEVRVGMERMHVSEKNQQRIVADVAKHVMAREGFTRGEAENNYRTVFNQLPEEDRPKWRSDYVDKPSALLNTLSARDQIKVVNPNVQWLPPSPDTPNVRTVQFRFDKEKRLASRVPTTQPMISTVTFTYDTNAVPTTVEDLATNPFGFVVLNYRADPAGRERELRGADGRIE